MKTIIENSTKQSKYIFNDDVVLVVSEQNIVAPEFVISDLNSNNSVIVENVNPPDDWFGCKYLYNNDTWTIDPNWVDPFANY